MQTYVHSASRLLFMFALVFISNQVFGQRNLKDIPDSDPEVERKSFILADGFEVNLFAADPQIAKPIQMNFDEKGRLWIAGSSVYPHIKPGQTANDKILILEDTDGDGKSDVTKVFADGLLIPTGIAPAPGGCYVANSTDLIHLIDTDGDDKADQKKVILSGFGTEDTHHLLHTLRWGHDGCLYMNQSIYIHSHVETPYGVKRLNAGGIWRFRPETLELDVLCEGFVNPWGHHFDRWGQSFATDGAYGEGINYVFPGSVFVTAYNAKRILKGLNPGSPKHCGLEIIGGDHLPAEFQGNMITNDFRANRVCRFVVSENGTSAFASRQETELIKTRHIAFRPIDVKMGPDGAIYIADWYNPIIQHGEVDFRDPRRDHTHGRIWRLTYKGRSPLKHPDLSKATIAELLQHLTSNQEWVRLHSKRMLKEFDPNVVIPRLGAWTQQKLQTPLENEHDLLESLWTYQSLRVVNEKLLNSLLTSPNHRVRAAAIRVAVDWRKRLSGNAFQIFAVAASDQHPRVRLEAVRALVHYPTIASVRAALKVLEQPMDDYLDFAIWKTVNELKDVWMPAFQSGEFAFDNDVQKMSFCLKAVNSPAVIEPLFKLAVRDETPDDKRREIFNTIALQGNGDELGKVVRWVLDHADQQSENAAAVLRSVSSASRQRNLQPKFQKTLILDLLKTNNANLKSAVVEALGVFRVAEANPVLIDIALGDSVDALGAIDSLALVGGEQSKSALLDLTSEKHPTAKRERAANVLTLLDPKLAAKQSVELLKSAPEGLRPALLIDFLLKTKSGPAMLKRELQKKSIETEMAKQAIRAVQASPRPDKSLIESLRLAGKVDAAKWILTPELTARMIEKVAAADPMKGELIYRREKLQCQKCHAIAGAGGVVGPEMNSIGASAQVDYLIESLIAPNKKIKENYHSKIVQTIDGLQVSGIPVRDDDNEIVLRTAEGKMVTIPAEDIEGKKDGQSLMPEGLVDSLTENELVDLVAFLSSLGKVGDFAISSKVYARNWQVLLWSQEANHRLNRTSFDTAASDEEVFQWREEYALVNGSVPLSELPQYKIHRRTPETVFLRTELNVDVAGKVQLLFDSVTEIKIWVDGKPREIAKQMDLELSKGSHRIVLAVTKSKQDPVRLELNAKESVPANWK